jgi:hypothetical protein
MKVLDLQCRQSHVFEGWFASEDVFQDQRRRGLVQCPLCSDDQIEKRLSAPRLNLGAREPAKAQVEPRAAQARSNAGGLPPEVQALATAAPALPPAVQAAWLELARKVVAHTEDVGAQFAQEARRMHYGEAQERAIRGQASVDEAMELRDEGIAVVPLPLPTAAKETLQ